MNKPIRVSSVAYEMLVEIAKKAKLKPDQYIEHLIHIQYKNK
jgi:hypothetical protein|tara:strand:+ start:660 stop:785 length:126 start_codon:yes stop_codon:yes gene_type:complete